MSTGFTENGLDISEKYVGIDDADLMQDYLTPEGKRKYISGNLNLHGGNADGQLGTGNTTSNVGSTFTLIGTDTWKEASGGLSRTLAIKSNGTLWATGDGDTYGLGNGVAADVSTFIQVGTDTDWKFIRTYESQIGLKTNGTIWSWGTNVYGQLGNAGVDTVSTPIQIGSDTDWSYISVSLYSSFGLKSDGSIWSWGANTWGILGQGILSSVRLSTPTQIGTDFDWVQIEASQNSVCALKSDGSIWTWGYDANGQLGQGTESVHLSSPVKVGADTDWYRICPMNRDSMGVIKTDGTLWTWGGNTSGVLGLGDTTVRSTPVQVGSLTDWEVVSFSIVVFAIKTDGTLWAWGDAPYNPASATYVSSPVQFESDTDWMRPKTCWGNSMVLKIPV